MQKSSSMLNMSSEKMNTCTQQELAPPPYQSDQDTLPSYIESSPLSEIEIIVTRFAPRWDDQRVYHSFNNEKYDQSLPNNNNNNNNRKVGHLLDRMEAYRHKDQEWSSHNQIKMKQLTKNMYTTQSGTGGHKKVPSLSSAKSKYQKITLSIAKEREHIVHRMKKIRPSSSSSSSCTEEFDLFLNSVYVTSSQLRMSNQCATRLVPIV